MELETYLKRLENFKDEPDRTDNEGYWERQREFGIYDNWPILLKADYGKVINDLKSNSNYDFSQDNEGDERSFIHSRDAILQVVRNPPLGLVSEGSTSRMRGLELENFNKMKENFNMGIILHPKKDSWLRGISREIGSIGNYAKKEKIALCFPRSCGAKLEGDERFSEVVYYHPSEEA